MKIYYSQSSPFVRKCLVVAHELGVADRIEKLSCTAHVINRSMEIAKDNPLGQVPTLLTDDGTALHDSRVICEYLDTTFDGSLFPVEGPARWDRLVELSLADGMTGATLLARYERHLRPEAFQWSDWETAQLGKVHAGLAWFEERVSEFGERVDIGKIAFACSLGYLDFRFPHVPWREEAPRSAAWFERFNARPSMKETMPPA